MCGKPFGKRLDQSAQLLSDQIVSTVQSNSKTNISVLMPTSSMVKDETVYDLVLFTTEDGVSEKKLRKLQLFRDMSELYYSHFHFRAIVFTNTIQLHQFFRNTSILTLSNFKYTLPFSPSCLEPTPMDYQPSPPCSPLPNNLFIAITMAISIPTFFFNLPFLMSCNSASSKSL